MTRHFGWEGFAFGFPPAEYALDAYLRLLASQAPGAPWLVGGLAVMVQTFPGPGLPLPLCNPVLRYNCQPKGF